MADSVDKATFDALDKGWVTSAGVLTAAPWFPEVAFWANQHKQADLGVQLDLTSDWKNCCWRAVSPQAAGSSLLDSTGYFPLSEAYAARHAKPDEAEREARAQVDLALKTGVPVTHLDNHMRVMLTTPTSSASTGNSDRSTSCPSCCRANKSEPSDLPPFSAQ